MKILVVEDEKSLADNIAKIFRENERFAVDVAYDGNEGLFHAQGSKYDLIILDLMLPGLSGYEILEKLRGEGNLIPVLILTAKDSKEDVIRGLNYGSDDYLTKPFDTGELIARSKALIRRAYGKISPMVEVGNVSLDTVKRVAYRNGNVLDLTAMEYMAFEYLAMKAGSVVSKEELLEHLYDFNWEKFSNVIEVYISGLRRKLGEDRDLIKTLRGRGYCLGEIN